MATNRSNLKGVQAAQLAGSVRASTEAEAEAAEQVIKFLHTWPVFARVTDGGTAGTADAETVIFVAPFACKVVAATLTTPVNVTANDTTYATVTVAKRAADGGSSATVASETTQTTGSGGSGNLTAFAPFALPLTAANVELAAGAVLTVAVAKAGAGVAVGSATAEALVEVLVEAI
jgi:hypothetical protein